MATHDPTPHCWICGEPVRLEDCKIDELGRAVHENCYITRVLPDRAPQGTDAPPRKPPGPGKRARSRLRERPRRTLSPQNNRQRS